MSSTEFNPLRPKAGADIEAPKRRDYEKEIVGPVEALKESFDVETFGEVTYGEKRYSLFLISSKVKDDMLPNVFISGGVHGSEPAGALATLEYLKKYGKAYEGKANLFVVPCVNPSGFESGKRMNAGDTDVNRDFFNASAQETKLMKAMLEKVGHTYSFSLDMHEDSMDDIDPEHPEETSPKEAYLYESSASKESSIGASLIASLEKDGVAFSKAEEIYGLQNENGLLWSPWHGGEAKEEFSTLEDYMQKYAWHTFTVETPAQLPLKERIDIHMKILRKVMNIFHGAKE